MDAITRKNKLSELMSNDNNIAMTGIPLQYKGETRIEKVYRIPLDYLIYNKYNGRIGSDVLSYEKQNGSLIKIERLSNGFYMSQKRTGTKQQCTVC